MVVLPFDLFPSPPETPVGVGREWGVEGVVGRCACGAGKENMIVSK